MYGWTRWDPELGSLDPWLLLAGLAMVGSRRTLA